MTDGEDALDFAKDGAAWPNSTYSRFVRASGFNWHVQVMGSGPPLLLVHGTGASTHSWRDVAPLLARAHTVIIPDLPGHGFTDMPSLDAFTLPGMAAALSDLLDAIDVKPEVCAGHSAGVAVLIEATLQKRIRPRVIVSFNGALLPFQGFAGQVFSPLAKLLFLNPLTPKLFAWRGRDRESVARLLRSTGSKVGDEDVELYRRLFATSKHCAAALTMMARWDLDSFVRRLARSETPLILVTGDHDQAIRSADAYRVAGMVQRASVVEVPGAGHLLHEERPDFAAQIVERATQDWAGAAS